MPCQCEDHIPADLIKEICKQPKLFAAVMNLFGEIQLSPQRMKAEHRAALTFLKVVDPKHLVELASNGFISFGLLRLHQDGTLSRKKGAGLGCINTLSSSLLPRFDQLTNMYLYLRGDPQRVLDIVDRRRFMFGARWRTSTSEIEEVEWDYIVSKPFIFVTLGVHLLVKGVPEHGVRALKLWAKIMGMRTKTTKEGFILIGNGASHAPEGWPVKVPEFYARRLQNLIGLPEEHTLAMIKAVKKTVSVEEAFTTEEMIPYIQEVNRLTQEKLAASGQATFKELIDTIIAPSWTEAIAYCAAHPQFQVDDEAKVEAQNIPQVNQPMVNL